MITPILDNCIACGRQSKTPGAGICLQCEITALIDLSFERMRAALRGQIPTIGKRLQATKNATKGNR